MCDIQKRLELLAKPSWSYKDIMEYFPDRASSTATATKIKNRAIAEYNGSVRFGNNLVSTDSVLQMFGSSREKEIAIISAMNEVKND